MKVIVTEIQGKAASLYIAGLNMREIALELGVSYSRVVQIINAILIKTRSASKREFLLNAKDIEWVIKK